MSRNTLVFGTGLLACLLVAQTLTAGTASELSPRDVSIVGRQWTWAGGFDHSSGWDSYGVFGTKGVAAPGNRPGHEVVRLVDGREREPLALRGRRLRDEGLRLAQRSLEVGRDELDLGEWLGRDQPARDVWNEGGSRTGERARCAIRLDLLDGRERKPVALRRPWLRGERGRMAQRPLEVGRDELDLGERVGRRESARDVRYEGNRGIRGTCPERGLLGLVGGHSGNLWLFGGWATGRRRAGST